MKILIWRSWRPLFDPPATFSAVAKTAMGGTDNQLLWHARALRQMGHEVRIYGVSADDIIEEGVAFVGAKDRTAQEDRLRAESPHPDVVVTEGAFDLIDIAKSIFPHAFTIHVGQNVDLEHKGKNDVFNKGDLADAFAFVGHGQAAYYNLTRPDLRSKFFVVPNIVPWEALYRDIPRGPVTDSIVWVGHWGKQGLREWARAMSRILREHPTYRWVVCGPKYGTDDALSPEWALRGIDLPRDRVEFRSMPLSELAQTLGEARAVMVSLGLENACISALDAHAMGRPVLSGNTLTYKYANPEGTGLRVHTDDELYAALKLMIERPDVADAMGRQGQEWVVANYAEPSLRLAWAQVLTFAQTRNAMKDLARTKPPSRARDEIDKLRYRIDRKVATWGR